MRSRSPFRLLAIARSSPAHWAAHSRPSLATARVVPYYIVHFVLDNIPYDIVGHHVARMISSGENSIVIRKKKQVSHFMNNIPWKHILRPISEVGISYALNIKRHGVRFYKYKILRSDACLRMEIWQIVKGEIEFYVTVSMLPVAFVPSVIR